MAMRMRTLLAAAAVFAIVGCGQKPSETPPAGGATPATAGAGAEVASVAAQLDPCQDKAGLAQKVCKDPTLGPAAARVQAALAEAAANVSSDGDKLIVEGQRSWLEAQAINCGVPLNDPKAGACLKAALEERLKDAKATVEQRGGFTFQKVEIHAAAPVTAQAAADAGFSGEDGPAAVAHELRYPRIDNAGDQAAQKFNAIMAAMGKPRFKLQDATSETTDYEIAFASRQLVSVRFTTSEFNLGAAHPNNGMTSVTVLMGEGREIAPTDVFRADSGWETFVTRRALKGLTKTFSEIGAGTPDPKDVRDTATKVHNWTITDGGLRVAFPPYSVGPSALGALEVEIPWKDLAPYVNPNAPPPIAAAKAG